MASGIVQLFAASAAFLGTHFALSHPLRQPLVATVSGDCRAAVIGCLGHLALLW